MTTGPPIQLKGGLSETGPIHNPHKNVSPKTCLFIVMWERMLWMLWLWLSVMLSFNEQLQVPNILDDVVIILLS